MKVLVIGKPRYDILIELPKYLVEGSKNEITSTLESAGGNSIYSAIMLSKWGFEVNYTGVVGSDAYGTKIKQVLDGYNINTKFLEVNYENPTDIRYIFINNENGSSTQILKTRKDVLLTKFNYDFIPDVILMDGTDLSGSFAALNNFPKAISILLANEISEDIHSLSKRVSYVSASLNFVKALTKLEFDFKHPKQLVNVFQKVRDFNKAQYLIMLQDKGVLYTNDLQVKMISGLKTVVKDNTYSGAAFVSALTYGIIQKMDIDSIAKIANISGALSLTKVGLINSIPELKEVLQMAGLSIKEDDISEVKKEEAPVENL